MRTRWRRANGGRGDAAAHGGARRPGWRWRGCGHHGFLGGTRARHRLPGYASGRSGGDRCVLPFPRLPSSCRANGTSPLSPATDFLEALERVTASPDAQAVAVADRSMLPFRRLPTSYRAAVMEELYFTWFSKISGQMSSRLLFIFPAS